MMTSLHIWIFFCFQGSVAFHWANQTQNSSLIQTCAGRDIIFPWFFLLDNGEQVVDIKWLYTPDGQTPDMMANYIYGHFDALPPFTQRLRHLGNGSLEMTHVSLKDSGNYIIEVSINKGGAFSVIRHTIVVQVAEPPSSSEGELTVTQTDQAVYDNTTGQFHVQLMCGHLSSRGQPPVDVVWTTPSGSEETSSNRDNGHFYLLLPNPVKGGNYSCRLPPHSAATLCLPADAPLLRETTVQVDAVTARLTLVEAKEEALNNKLKEENRLLREELNHTRTSLETQLSEYRAKSSIRITFYAKKGNNEALNGGAHVKFNHIYTNEGGAYSATTGDFTVPVNGTYFFAFTSSPYGGSSYYGDCYLRVDGNIITYVYMKYSDYYNQATGHAVLHLVKGQQVWVASASSDRFEANLSFFSGFLINPDW